MNKIPTVFLRDENDRSKVTNQVHPDCEWVMRGEGVATRMYDGTCVMFDGERWWARREVKPDKLEPDNFVLISVDPTTMKKMGWEPIEQSPFYKFWSEAIRNAGNDPSSWKPGTYELCGPKINGNPEKCEGYHVLIRHDTAEVYPRRDGVPFGTAGVRSLVVALYTVLGWEGLVWHHPDGRMAKLKARDFK